VAILLDRLREAGAHEQAAALATRAAAHAALDDPGEVAILLDSLREAGAHQQAATLAARAAAHAALEDPQAVARLLDNLREAGARDQAAALLARDPAGHAALDGSYGVSLLLGSLRAAGAHQQAAALTGRLPAAGRFDLFLEQEGPADHFRFGREADGTPAAPWGWEDSDLRLVLRPRDREATLPIGLLSTRRIRKVSLDSFCPNVRSYIAKPGSALRLLAVFARKGQVSFPRLDCGVRA
jgi:hypothetical protein